MSPYQQHQEINAEAERLAKVLFGDVRSVDVAIIASHMVTVAKAARQQALEEAAEVCDTQGERGGENGYSCAAEIRGLQ